MNWHLDSDNLFIFVPPRCLIPFSYVAPSFSFALNSYLHSQKTCTTLIPYAKCSSSTNTSLNLVGSDGRRTDEYSAIDLILHRNKNQKLLLRAIRQKGTKNSAIDRSRKGTDSTDDVQRLRKIESYTRITFKIPTSPPCRSILRDGLGPFLRAKLPGLPPKQVYSTTT